MRVGEVVQSGVEHIILACQSPWPEVGQLVIHEDRPLVGMVTSLREEPLDASRRAEPLAKIDETAAALRSRLPHLALILQVWAEVTLLGELPTLSEQRQLVPLHEFFRQATAREQEQVLSAPNLATLLVSHDLADSVLIAFVATLPAAAQKSLIRQLVGLMHADWPRLRSLLLRLEQHG